MSADANTTGNDILAGEAAQLTLQVGYEARTATQQWLRLRLRSLFTQ